MLKSGIWPNVVTFNMIIDGACRMGDIELTSVEDVSNVDEFYFTQLCNLQFYH